MRIAVWKTGHEIADTVAEAVYEGLKEHNCSIMWTNRIDDRSIQEADIHICYGILRGSSDVFRMAKKLGKHWINIDRGYWKPGHYAGYYRISFCGTQQTFGLDKLKPDYDRWDRLGIEIIDSTYENRDIWVHCPPTKPVEQFFGIQQKVLPEHSGIRIRDKDTLRKLQSDLDRCNMLTTFNSSVGWEALRQGIPVISDPNHSIVGAYQKMLDRSIHQDSNARRDLFALQSALQLTLDEIRQGMLWPLLQNLLMCTSDGTHEKL